MEETKRLYSVRKLLNSAFGSRPCPLPLGPLRFGTRHSHRQARQVHLFVVYGKGWRFRKPRIGIIPDVRSPLSWPSP
jgi:hypothetical protein